MITIRNGVFETNSSSSHSIVVKKEGTKPEGLIDPGWKAKDGILDIWSRELSFGWQFEILYEWYDKLRFAIASFCHWDGKDGLTDIEEACKRRIKDFKEFNFIHYKDDSVYGDIDHQSDGLLQNFLSDNDVSIEDFIFNNKYIAIIDNDNSANFYQVSKAGLFNRAAVETVYPDCYMENDDEDI